MTKKRRRKPWIIRHFSKLGFTNRLALYALVFLMISIVLGFILAVMSIRCGANFTLAAYTCSVAPIGTFVSIAIGKAIDKSKFENIQGGVKYETAMASLNSQVMEGNTELIDDSTPTI